MMKAQVGSYEMQSSTSVNTTAHMVPKHDLPVKKGPEVQVQSSIVTVSYLLYLVNCHVLSCEDGLPRSLT
jgi:hypothetical protein